MDGGSHPYERGEEGKGIGAVYEPIYTLLRGGAQRDTGWGMGRRPTIPFFYVLPSQ